MRPVEVLTLAIHPPGHSILFRNQMMTRPEQRDSRRAQEMNLFGQIGECPWLGQRPAARGLPAPPTRERGENQGDPSTY